MKNNQVVYWILGGLFLLMALDRLFFLPSLPSLFSDFVQMSDHPFPMFVEGLIVELLFDVALVCIGLWIIKQKGEALVQLTLLALSTLVCLGALEGVLRLGVFDMKNAPSPIWIPPPLKELDKKIDEANKVLAEKNPFYFTDIIRSEKKAASIKKRIAAVGDSVIFGDGLPWQKTWSHQLEQMVDRSHPDIEVLSWGQDGWSTKSQWKFIKSHALSFGIDFIIWGWNANDVDLGDIPQIHFKWQESPLWHLPKKTFPYSFDFLSTLLSKGLEYIVKSYGYANWIERLYEPEELKAYGELLQEISTFSQKNNVGLLLVFTPTDLTPFSRESFEKILPLVEEAEINHLNLYPKAFDRFKDIPPRQLWANPADPHPGEKLSEFFAREIYDYLTSVKLLDASKPIELTSKIEPAR